jgi:hypothetical protein
LTEKIKIKIKIGILLPFQLLERGAKRHLGASAHIGRQQELARSLGRVKAPL